MVQSLAPRAPWVTPAQVWPQLPTELQIRAIRLLAHLACACATAPSAPRLKESDDVSPPSSNQNPSRPS
jgi:hypothetical protein